MESHTRRRVSGMLVAAGVAAMLLSGVATAKTGRVEQTGVFALLGGTPKILAKFWADHPSGLSATLKVRQFMLDGKPILDYDVDMEHIMHLIVVRDDFATFSHLHADFDTTTGPFGSNSPKSRIIATTSTPIQCPTPSVGKSFVLRLRAPGPLRNRSRCFTPCRLRYSRGDSA
jgi:hypothetical protein